MPIGRLGMKTISSSPPIRSKRSKIMGLIDDDYLLDQDVFCEIIKEFMNTDYKTDKELTLIYCSSKGENE